MDLDRVVLDVQVSKDLNLRQLGSDQIDFLYIGIRLQRERETRPRLEGPGEIRGTEGGSALYVVVGANEEWSVEIPALTAALRELDAGAYWLHVYTMVTPVSVQHHAGAGPPGTRRPLALGEELHLEIGEQSRSTGSVQSFTIERVDGSVDAGLFVRDNEQLGTA